jgi:hypothetical protein
MEATQQLAGRAARGQKGSAMRGREGGVTRGNTATSQHKTMRWWHSERTTRGLDDGATRDDATTRWCNETARGWHSERTTRWRECGVMKDETTA